MAINLAILLISFVAMEGVAWLTHKYVMHGVLWCLHKDHHAPAHDQVLQKNDLFFVIFALPGIALIAAGAAHGWSSWHAWAGAGITLYGLAYFLVHELFIHRRLKVFGAGKHPYLVAVRRAHKAHHKHLQKEDGECFGMLLVPPRVLRDAVFRTDAREQETKVDQQAT